VHLNLEKLRQDFKSCRRKDKTLAFRLSILIEITKIEMTFIYNIAAKTVKITTLCMSLEVSLRTIQRWKKSYLKSGIKSLRKKKACGNKAKPILGHTALLITDMRKNYRWGAEVICAHLLYDHKIDIKKNRIERYLTLSGLRKKYPCTTCKKTKGNKTKEHKTVVKVENPGHHTQVDTKHLPHIFIQPHIKCYVYNFIDHTVRTITRN
jgi:transposase